jgi:putative transposase
MSSRAYKSQKHHRRSIRLKGYDYSQTGAYFVTICSYNRESIFGEIVDGEAILSRYGRIVLTDWQNLAKRHPHIELGAFTVMPNHVHGIVVMKDTPVGADSKLVSGTARQSSLPEIVRGFKTFSARRVNRARRAVGSVWQRNYWEHVIRNQEAFNRIHEYILTNPQRWQLDRENPNRIGEDNFDRWLDSM